MNPDKLIELVIKACSENDSNVVQMVDELKQSQLMNIPQVKKIIHNTMFNNGVFNRLIQDQLNEEQRFCLSLWTMNFEYAKHTPNRYYRVLLTHYLNHLNEPVENSNYDVLPFIKDYYQKTPSIFVIDNDTFNKSIEIPELKLNSNYLSYIPELIKIGKSVQFNCSGFIKNELYYLMCGCCVVYHIINFDRYKTFKSFYRSIQSFIQLFPNSISISCDLFKSNTINERNETDNNIKIYSLSTALIFNNHKGFEDIINKNFNYRYKEAFKYLDNKKNIDKLTQIKTDDLGIHLLTELSNNDIDKLFNEFEILFKQLKETNQKNECTDLILNELLIKWFDSQCLTRSTCLTGILMLMILKHSIIKLTENELIDWKAIICGNIDNTYEIIDEIKPSKKMIDDFKQLKLIDVLTMFKFYVQVVSDSLVN